MRIVLAAAVLTAVACSRSGAPAAPPPASPPAGGSARVVATFRGEVDVARGTLTLARDGAAGATTRLVAIPIVQDGVPGSGPRDTVELVTGSSSTVAGDCGGGSTLVATVQLRSFFAQTELRDAFVVIDTIDATHAACNSDGNPPAGVSNQYGLFRYGNVAAGGTATATWKFRLPDQTRFAFTGRVLAQKLNLPNTYVQLFKWRWTDIAKECADFLGPQGFGAVQISPPAAHQTANAWWNMYQPVNYRALVSDMGDEAQLQAMIDACHDAGVRVYVDAVFNQMALVQGDAVATDGSHFNGWNHQFPFFGPADFHNCGLDKNNYNVNSTDARANIVNCALDAMPDLATETSYVQGQLGDYLTHLLNMGVDGFRIDAAKHIWPGDLHTILAKAGTTTRLGEPVYVTQEIILDANVVRSDYFQNGTINEFRFTYLMRDAFRKNSGFGIAQLPQKMGTGDGGGDLGLVPSANATIFVDNHDTERHADQSLNLQTDSNKSFDLANVYMLTQPYGRAQLQSGYRFSLSSVDQNHPSASPYDGAGQAKIMVDWDFVHRWGDLYPLVAFRNATAGQPMTGIVTGTNHQLAYRRGNVGFVALNNDTSAWSRTFATGLPEGTYCNVVHGLLNQAGDGCTGDSVTVGASGDAAITVAAVGGTSVPAVVLYTGQKVGSGGGGGGGGGGFASSYPAMYLRGTMNAWGATAMSLVADHVWQVSATLGASTAYTFKFEIGGGATWSTNWGDTDANGVADAGGKDIPYTSVAAGSYVFTFHDDTLAYAVAYDGGSGGGGGGGGGGCTTVPVTFTIANANTAFGENLYVVGDQAALGSWTPAQGFALTIQGSGANVPWTGTVDLPPGTALQYKYVKYNASTGVATWESSQSNASGNRTATTAACGGSTALDDGSFKF